MALDTPTKARTPAQAAPDRGAGRLLDKKTQRNLAKAAVIAALGVLVWTGMQRPRRRYMPLHTWAGMALIGLTLWHWTLYLPRPEKQVPRSAVRTGARAAPAGRTAED